MQSSPKNLKQNKSIGQKEPSPVTEPGQDPGDVRPPLSHSITYIPEEAAPGESQRFLKNSRYFTICVYGIVMVIFSAIIFKTIIDFDKTKAGLGQLFDMLAPFIFGALLAYVLNPMVHMFYVLLGRLAKKTGLPLKHSIHTAISIAITYVIVVGFVVLTLLFVLPEIAQNLIDFVNYIPTAYDMLLDFLAYLQERFPSVDIEAISEPVTNVLPNLIANLRNLATNMMPAIYAFSMSVASWIVNLLITLIVSIYMVYDKRRLMQSCWRIIYAFLPKKHIPACHEIMTECNRLFSSFVVGKFIDSLIIGALCFILMTVFEFPYTTLISIIVGVTNMIPYFGPFIGAAPGIVIILFISPLKALGFAVMILCIQQFDGIILGPKILGNTTGMKPLWIIFAITIGGKLFGVIGMFLGVPVVAIIYYLLDIYLGYRLSKKGIPESAVESALSGLDLDD